MNTTYKIQILDGKTNLGDYGTLDADGKAVEYIGRNSAESAARKLASGELANGEYKGMTCKPYAVEETNMIEVTTISKVSRPYGPNRTVDVSADSVRYSIALGQGGNVGL